LGGVACRTSSGKQVSDSMKKGINACGTHTVSGFKKRGKTNTNAKCQEGKGRKGGKTAEKENRSHQCTVWQIAHLQIRTHKTDKKRERDCNRKEKEKMTEERKGEPVGKRKIAFLQGG